MMNRHAPPGLTSISWIVVVKPVGPHHWAICRGSVHALNTSSLGALKTRLMTISRSVVVEVSATATSFLQLLQQLGKAIVTLAHPCLSARMKHAVAILRRLEDTLHP